MNGGGLERFLSNWTVRSILIGAVGSVIDLCVLLFTAKVVGLPAPLAAACGVTCGATSNFLLNRKYAFAMQNQPMSGPAVRFALGTAVLITIHAGVVAFLSNLGAHLLVAKYGADVMVLLGGNLLLLRYVVFPKPATVPATA